MTTRPIPNLRRTTLALAAALVLAAGPGACAHRPPAAPAYTPSEAGPQVFVSWFRPWGEPGAAQERRPACADTTGEDTLFVCMRANKDLPSMVAFTGDLWFRAAPSESLGTWWHFERGAANQSGLAARFKPVAGERGESPPWRVEGVGVVGYLRERSAGHLRMAFAVDPKSAVAIEGGRVYTLARIVVKARRSGLTGCEQGIAVELARASIATDGVTEYPVTTGGARYATSGRRGLAALAGVLGVGEKDARARLRAVEPPAGWNLPK